jgi:hypothetical protein
VEENPLCDYNSGLPLNSNDFLKLQKEGNKMNMQITVPEENVFWSKQWETRIEKEEELDATSIPMSSGLRCLPHQYRIQILQQYYLERLISHLRMS